MKRGLLLTLFFCFVLNLHAQRRNTYNNSIGVGIDLTSFNLQTDDVAVTSKIGWAAGLETRGKFRPFADLIFGIQLFNNNFSVEEAISGEEINMSVIGAEVKFLYAAKPWRSDNFSFEIGPALSFNGEYKVEDARFEESIIAGESAVLVSSFQETTPINFTGIVGFSAGTRKIRFSAHYHYAFLDALNGKNAQSEELNGTMSYLSFGLRLYF